MRQVIADIKFFLGDNADKTPLQNSLVFKSIINNPKNHHAGLFVLDGKEFNRLTLDKINYIFVIAPKPFAIVIDDKVALYTTQFTYMNPHGSIDAVLFPHSYGQVPVRYLYGTMAFGDCETAMNLTDEECNAIEYDTVLEDLIYDSAPGDNEFSSAVISDFGDCEFGFEWDEALQKLVMKPCDSCS